MCMFTDDNGEVDIDGPGSSDYDRPPEDRDGIDTQERRMAPDSILSRPGLLAGQSLRSL